MPDPHKEPQRKESLDEIVSRSAVVLADQIQKAAAWAQSEEQLDDPVSKIWDIPATEMKAIRSALSELGYPAENEHGQEEED